MKLGEQLSKAKIPNSELYPYVLASPTSVQISLSYRPADGDLIKFVRLNRNLRINCEIGTEFAMYRFFVREIGPYLTMHLYSRLTKGDFCVSGSENVLHLLSANVPSTATAEDKLYHIPATHKAMALLGGAFRWCRS